MKKMIVIFTCLFLATGSTVFAAEKKEAISKPVNLFPQGDMEKAKIVPEKDPLMMAVPAKDKADGWCVNPKDALVIVKDAHSGKQAIKISSKKGEPVWVNYFVPIKASEGVLNFYYKLNTPEKEGELSFFMVPWNWELLEVGQRSSVNVSVAEAKDGKWHKATINFYCAEDHEGFMLAPRIASENAAQIPCDWFIDDVEIFAANPK